MNDNDSPAVVQEVDRNDHLQFQLKLCRKFLRLKDSATSRGLEFNLNLTSVSNLLKAKKCFFTGAELTLEPDLPNSLTVDRVDNSKGYIKGNVVACSQYFNKKKDNLSVQEITQLYKGLKKNGAIKNI